MSPTLAMQNSAFWAGVRMTAQTIGSLGCALYEKQGESRKEIRNDLNSILSISPDGEHSAMEFWEGIATCILLTGNAFAEKNYIGDRLVSLVLLNPETVIVRRDTQSYRLYYEYIDPITNRPKKYTTDQIFHIRGWGIGGDTGLSPIKYGAQSLATARAADKSAAVTFANGMRNAGFLFSKTVFDKEHRELVKQNIIEPVTGTGNSGKIGLLEGDNFDFKAISMSPEDAQLLATRAFGVEEVCRWIGIPPVLVGHASAGQTMWGTGIGQIIGGWYTLGLRPLLRRIEKAAGMQLIPIANRRRWYAEFTVEELLRADPAIRGEFYWKLIQIGAITPNQICRAENYPDYPGGDRHFINSTLAPLDDQGIPIKTAPTQPNPADANSPGVQNPMNPPPQSAQSQLEDIRSLLRVVK
jgi:HK97 family phage portal protein